MGVCNLLTNTHISVLVADCGSLSSQTDGSVQLTNTHICVLVADCGSLSSPTDGSVQLTNTHICVLVADCGSLSSPTDGSVDLSSGTTEGKLATYSCGTGYLLSGDTQTTCQSSGFWDPSSAPSCLGEYMQYMLLIIWSSDFWLHTPRHHAPW